MFTATHCLFVRSHPNSDSNYNSNSMQIQPRFDAYRRAFVDHLARVKNQHWEQGLRELSARSLRNLVKTEPAYFVDATLPYLVSMTEAFCWLLLLLELFFLLSISLNCLHKFSCGRCNK